MNYTDYIIAATLNEHAKRLPIGSDKRKVMEDLSRLPYKGELLPLAKIIKKQNQARTIRWILPGYLPDKLKSHKSP